MSTAGEAGPDTADGVAGAVVRTRSSRVVYANPWMTVREDEVVWPDGSGGLYGVVHKPDFAVVLPRERGGFWLVQQYRYPTGRRSWEFPMGTWPPGHGGDPEQLARAELAEETGLRAGSLRLLGRLDAANGYSPTGFHVFLATDLTPGTASPEPTEIGMVERFVPDAELAEMIATGAFSDAPSLAALMLYRQLVG